MPVDDSILEDLEKTIQTEMGIVNVRRRKLRDMQEAINEIKLQPRNQIVLAVLDVPAVMDTDDPTVEVTPAVPGKPEHTIQVFDVTPSDKSTGSTVTNTRRQLIYDNLLADKSSLKI